MKSKLKVFATATVLSVALAAPVPSQAAFDPADRAASLISLGTRIQGIYDALALRFADRGFGSVAARLTAIGQSVMDRLTARACTIDPDNAAC